MDTFKERDSAFAFTQDGDSEFLMYLYDYTFTFDWGWWKRSQFVQMVLYSMLRPFVAGVFLGALLYRHGFLLGYQDSWNIL